MVGWLVGWLVGMGKVIGFDYYFICGICWPLWYMLAIVGDDDDDDE